MTALNFNSALNFVWAPGRDDPSDGYHVTPGDPGGGTFGGITEATWQRAQVHGVVAAGQLKNATIEQLRAVLKALYWNPCGDDLPSGLDLVVFNGKMMTGRYAFLFQQCLGFYGPDVDGYIGPISIGQARASHAPTLIRAQQGVHLAYLADLSTWAQFRTGWTNRLVSAASVAVGMTMP